MFPVKRFHRRVVRDLNARITSTMLVCLAALQDVPQSYYESAELDGANAFQQFIHITIPSVAHVIVYQAILNLINAFQ